METAADTSSMDKKPFTDRGEFLASLYQKGGFVLNCETVVTLHKISSEGQRWDVVDYGILAILSTGVELSLIIGDIDTGEPVHVFALNTTSKYVTHKDHFHTFSGEDGSLQGISFSEISVGRKVSRVVSQLLPQQSEEGDVPPAKRQKQYEEWVVINKEDVPVILGDDREAVAAPDSTQSGVAEGEQGEREETDFSLFGKKKEKKPELKIDEISGPSYFRHISHVGSETPTERAVLEASCKTEEGEEKKTGTFERATKRSSSFEFEPSTQMETEARPTSIVSSSSFISSTSGSSFSMPEPPPHLDDHEALLFQINTFDRRSLHHVSDEEIKKSKNQPDSERKRSLTSMFRTGFDLLMPKLQAMRQFSMVATISSTGEEEGFDEFDGLLFE